MTTLIWGIKASLVGYVRGAADGYIALEDGAEEAEGGFAFPAAEGGGFVGKVTLTGHRGLLYLELSSPLIERDDAGVVLTLVDDAGDRIPFARLDREPAPGDPAAASLTAAGAELFFGNYREGDELAPVALVQE